MRAVVLHEFGGIENAALGDRPKPEPKPGEVLLKVAACAVNFVDLVMMAGRHQSRPGLPFVPGKSPVGVIAAVGADVKGFKPGDRAMALTENGGFAEFVTIPETLCVVLPEAVPFAEAAAMSLIYDTAGFALRDRGRLAPGESVLILGATGGVGLAAIHLAKVMGAGQVLAGVASKDKSDIVREAGADAIVDLGAADLHESLRAQVFAATDNRGADVILDMLGGDYFDAGLRALAWRGRLVVIGFASGRIPALKANYLLVKNVEVSGLQISDYHKRRMADVRACFAEIFAWRAAGILKPLPIKTYPVEEFAAALRDIRDRTVRGRVVLSMTD